MLFIMRSWDGMFLRTGDCAGSVGAAASGLASDLVLAAAAAAAAAAGIGLVRMKFNEVQLCVGGLLQTDPQERAKTTTASSDCRPRPTVPDPVVPRAHTHLSPAQGRLLSWA